MARCVLAAIDGNRVLPSSGGLAGPARDGEKQVGSTTPPLFFWRWVERFTGGRVLEPTIVDEAYDLLAK